MKDYLLKNNLCDENYSVPICFYVPSDANINFKYYTSAEQQIDKVQAQFIYSDSIQRQAKFAAQNYEILLALPAEELKKAIQEDNAGSNMILSILLNGYVHIFQSIVEKIGNEKLVYDLLEAEINKPKNSPLLSTLLYHSLRCQNQNLAKFIFEKSKFDQLPAISVNTDSNPLLMAAEKNYPEWIEKLLATNKFNIDMTNTSKKTAAHLAAEYGNFESLKVLIERQANLLIMDFDGKTPCEYALNHEIEIDEAYHLLGFTPFHVAIYQEDINKLKKAIIENVHEINTPDRAGNTPINYAVKNKNLNAFQLLLESGANINQPDNQGKTPAHYAMRDEKNSLELLKLLSTCPQINWHVKDKDGNTPLHIAAHCLNTSALKLLNHSVDNWNSVNDKGQTLAHLAAATAINNNVLTFLIMQSNINWNKEDNNGQTPVHYAAKAGYLPGLTALQTVTDIDWNKVDKNGQTPLYLAAKNVPFEEDDLFDANTDKNKMQVDISALTMLTQNGADLYSAAFIAVKQGEAQLLEIFSMLGVNISIVQHIGLSDDFNQLHSLVTQIKCLPDEINPKLNAHLLTLKEQADQYFQAGTQSFKSVNSQEDWQIAIHHLQEAYMKIKHELDDFNSIKIKIDTQLINEDEILDENIKEKINTILLNKVEWNNATLADLLNKKQNAALTLKEISEMANQLLDISKKYPTVSSVTMAQENQEVLSFYTILRDLPNKKMALNRLEEIYNVITENKLNTKFK